MKLKMKLKVMLKVSSGHVKAAYLCTTEELASDEMGEARIIGGNWRKSNYTG